MLSAISPADVVGPILFGALFAGIGLLAMLDWQKRRRAKRGIRPPIETNLLRPAGYSLQSRVQELDEKLNNSMILILLMGGALALLASLVGGVVFSPKMAEWLHQNGGPSAYFRRPMLPTTLGAILFLTGNTFGLIYEWCRFNRLVAEMRNHRLGLRGEQAVAEALQEVAHLGYRAFHDIPAGKSWNIDHVVVGPGGVFTLETKTRSKCATATGQKEATVKYDGRVLQFPWGPNTAAVTQAAGAAKWLTEFIHRSTGRKVNVQPLLIIPGWYVDRTDPTDSVPAMNTIYLGKYLTGLPTSLSREDICVISHPIAEKCRDVEF
jgi:hypothetical protein